MGVLKISPPSDRPQLNSTVDDDIWDALYMRCWALYGLGRHADALAEIDAVLASKSGDLAMLQVGQAAFRKLFTARAYNRVICAALSLFSDTNLPFLHTHILHSQLRMQVLQRLGRHEAALAAADAVLAVCAQDGNGAVDARIVRNWALGADGDGGDEGGEGARKRARCG
jgi:hypothetical protein